MRESLVINNLPSGLCEMKIAAYTEINMSMVKREAVLHGVGRNKITSALSLRKGS